MTVSSSTRLPSRSYRSLWGSEATPVCTPSSPALSSSPLGNSAAGPTPTQATVESQHLLFLLSTPTGSSPEIMTGITTAAGLQRAPPAAPQGGSRLSSLPLPATGSSALLPPALLRTCLCHPPGAGITRAAPSEDMGPWRKQCGPVAPASQFLGVPGGILSFFGHFALTSLGCLWHGDRGLLCASQKSP